MTRIELEPLAAPSARRRRVEVVERKGLGHPDTICDEVAEALSLALCREYLARAGRVLHHNVDKALLLAGRSTPAFGGGRVEEPMRLVLGGRATAAWEDGGLDPNELARETAARWAREHLRFVEPAHLAIEPALRPGSAALQDLFARARPGANDTSVGVGYAPASETERLVLAADAWLRSTRTRAAFPALGDDVKLMAVRRERRLELTVAAAQVDRAVRDAAEYVRAKDALRAALEEHLRARLEQLDEARVVVNALDEPGRGLGGLYLTVLGTSAEGADGGEVGRGNRWNGLIPFQRPFTMEAAAGKNPVRHVGKLYTALAFELAERLVAEVDGLEEAECFLASRIGAPLEEPWLAAARLGTAPGVGLAELEPRIHAVFESALAGLPALVARLVRGEGRRGGFDPPPTHA